MLVRENRLWLLIVYGSFLGDREMGLGRERDNKIYFLIDIFFFLIRFYLLKVL